MQRLSEAELKKRIGRFINKKLQKYPNLARADKVDARSIWRVDRMLGSALGKTFGGSRPDDYSIKL